MNAIKFARSAGGAAVNTVKVTAAVVVIGASYAIVPACGAALGAFEGAIDGFVGTTRDLNRFWSRVARRDELDRATEWTVR